MMIFQAPFYSSSESKKAGACPSSSGCKVETYPAQDPFPSPGAPTSLDQLLRPIASRAPFWDVGGSPSTHGKHTQTWGRHAHFTQTVAPTRNPFFFLINVITKQLQTKRYSRTCYISLCLWQESVLRGSREVRFLVHLCVSNTAYVLDVQDICSE